MAASKALFAGLALLRALPSAGVVHEARGADSSDGSGVARRAFLAHTTALHPELVAQLLMQVEDDWKMEAGLFVSCNGTMGSDTKCNGARNAFERSCSKVVGAVLGGSGGDKDKATEYLGDICRQPALQGWKHDKCQSFADGVLNTMTDNEYQNRNYFDTSKVCTGLWSNLAAEEKLLLAEAEQKRARERLEAAKKAEAARVRAEQARAEAAKKAEQEAVKAAIEAEAQRKSKELQERRKAEEARVKAEEARLKAEAAARQRVEEERLKEERRKEEEAVRKAEDAKKAAEQAAARLKAKRDEAAKEEAAEAAARREAEAAMKKIHQLKAKKALHSKSPDKKLQKPQAASHTEVAKLHAASHTEVSTKATTVNKAAHHKVAVHK